MWKQTKAEQKWQNSKVCLPCKIHCINMIFWIKCVMWQSVIGYLSWRLESFLILTYYIIIFERWTFKLLCPRSIINKCLSKQLMFWDKFFFDNPNLNILKFWQLLINALSFLLISNVIEMLQWFWLSFIWESFWVQSLGISTM